MIPQAVFLFFFSFTNIISSSDFLPSESSHIRAKRLAVHPSRWRTNLWPNAIVPYDIAPHYSPWEKSVILSAMAEFHKVSCIRFRPRRPSDRYYLQINKYYNLERCFSYIGRQVVSLFRTYEGNVETRMKLDPSCLRYNGRGTVMHELMHILGFYHEHQRDDRDPRIGGHSGHYNYKIYPRATTYYMGYYDITSIMHYNFNGVTVLPRSDFSREDKRRINELYQCQHRGPQESTSYFDSDYARYLPEEDGDSLATNELRKRF